MSHRFLIHSLIEFGPLTAFFFVSWIWGFYPGVSTLILTTISALGLSLYTFRRIPLFLLSASALILICGIFTIWLHQPFWIVLEFTLSNLLFGLALFWAYYKKYHLLKSWFGHMFLISERGWMTLSFRWALMFLLVGFTNQLFWYLYPSAHEWTMFRFISTLAFFMFVISQLTVSRRERLPESTAWGLRKDS
jgi:intracellular septation protein